MFDAEGAAILCLSGEPLPPNPTLIEGPILLSRCGRRLLVKQDIRRLFFVHRRAHRARHPRTVVWASYDKESNTTTLGIAFLTSPVAHARWTHFYGKDAPQNHQG